MTYDFTARFTGAAQPNGPCDGSCTFYVEAINRSGGTDTVTHTFLGSTKTNYWTFSQTFATAQNIAASTHLRARLVPSVGTRETYTTTAPLPDRISAEGIDITVNDWTRDVDTGEIDYDIDVTFKDSTQDPACATSCGLVVDAYYTDGTVEQNQFQIGAHSLSGPVSAFGRRFTGSDLHPGEITELRASLTPAGVTEPRYTDVVPVSASYPAGDLWIDLHEWHREGFPDAEGRYDFEVSFAGAGQVGGPCDGSCFLHVEGIQRDGESETLVHAFSPTVMGFTGQWNYSDRFTGTSPSSDITHIEARLIPVGEGADERVSYEATDSVTDDMVGGFDVSFLVSGLAARNVDLLELCLEVQEATVYLDIDADSPTHPAKACLTAPSLRAAVIAMATVSGGIGLYVAGTLLSSDPQDFLLGSIENPADDAEVQPEPEPAAAGSGIQLPPNCMTSGQDALRNSLPEQTHHIATNKNRVAEPKWTDQFEALLWRYYPARSLDEDWNKINNMPHRGSHPFLYHLWVYQSMERALRRSNNDWNEFLRRWNLWVKDVVQNDPLVARREYWSCR